MYNRFACYTYQIDGYWLILFATSYYDAAVKIWTWHGDIDTPIHRTIYQP